MSWTKVLGHAAADHQQAGHARGDFYVGQLAKIGDAVEREVGLARLGAIDLVLDEAEPGTGVGEGGAENGHVMLVGELDEAVGFLAVHGQPLAHLADEGAAAVGLGRQAVGDFEDRVIGLLERHLVDIGIVDAIDIERAQSIVVGFVERLIMFVAERLKEIHVDDRRAGRDDAVDHVVGEQVRVEVHATARAGGAGDDEEDGAVPVGEHLIVDARRPAEIAAGEAHVLHRVHDRARVEGLDVDMLDLVREQFGLAGVVGRAVMCVSSHWGGWLGGMCAAARGRKSPAPSGLTNQWGCNAEQPHNDEK